MAKPKFREGDEVLIGRGGFGRPPVRARVAQDWDGESQVMVIPLGRAKPVPRSPSLVRLAERPGGPSLRQGKPPKAKPKLAPRPKRGPIRSATYLEFVAAHPCRACDAKPPSDAHHWGPTRGLGLKVSDVRTVPLCRRCHDHFHDHGHLYALDARTTREAFLRWQVDLLEEWFERRTAADRRSRDR